MVYYIFGFVNRQEIEMLENDKLLVLILALSIVHSERVDAQPLSKTAFVLYHLIYAAYDMGEYIKIVIEELIDEGYIEQVDYLVKLTEKGVERAMKVVTTTE